VVTKAITKLVSSLNPAGAVIQAIIFIYDTITFLVDKISKIAQVGFAVLDSIVNIANGVLGAAIKKVEQTLAGMLTLAINFLAHFLGLGKVSKKIVEIVKKLQEKVDAAIDKAILFVVNAAKKFLKSLLGKIKGEEDKRTDAQKKADVEAAIKEVTVLDNDASIDKKKFKAGLAAIKKKYRLKSITMTPTTGDKYDVVAEINPRKKKGVDVKDSEEVKKFKAKYASEIGKTHKKAAPVINKEIENNIKDLKKARSWKGVEKKLKEGALAGEQTKPVDNNHAFGKSVKSKEGISGLKKAIKESGKTQKKVLDGLSLSDYVDRRRGAIHGGSGGNATKVLESARNYIFNNSISGLVEAAFAIFFKNSLSGTSEHNKFFPVNIVEKPVKGGGKKITYTYAEGAQSFTVTINGSGYPVSVSAENLELHDLGRGTTQNPDGKVLNAGMDSAHIVANMFGGSGYKKAHNIVATSAYYNQGAMLGTENKIKDWLKKIPKLDIFKLKITVSYYGEKDTVDLSEIKKAIKSKTKDDDERRKLSDGKLDKRVKSILKQTDQPRVKDLVYNARAYDSKNKLLKKKTFNIGEGDVLFGTG